VRKFGQASKVAVNRRDGQTPPALKLPAIGGKPTEPALPEELGGNKMLSNTGPFLDFLFISGHGVILAS
jgi:hypothetical protein